MANHILTTGDSLAVRRWGMYGLAISAALLGGAALAKSEAVSIWWTPGDGKVLPATAEFPNPAGTLQIFNAGGPIDTANHPFFTPLKPDGRACVTCHQPAYGMSISAEGVRRRWDETGGRDALFNAIDGSNCPNLPQREAKSHSLLLSKGLFRIPMPWPPRDDAGNKLEPDFSIEVLSDPTGCNTSADYGLTAADPQVSVYRRPRMAANLKYVESDVPLGLWQVRSGTVLPLDPERGARLSGNLMADGRSSTLNLQMTDAMTRHIEAHDVPSKSAMKQIRDFEIQLFAAQVSDKVGGSLQSGGAAMGPKALAMGKAGVLGSFPERPTFPELNGWRTAKTLAAMTWSPIFARVKAEKLPTARVGEVQETREQRAFRDSVARGYDSFLYRQFLIRDAGSLNTLLGNPVKQTCAGCHNMQHTGSDNAPGYLGLGTTNFPTATPAPDLPLFKITCRKDRPPHPFLGRVIYTNDPGRGLVTGKCADVGAITAQQMRALAARAPYFAGGSANTIRDIVEFYDRRFRIGYTEQEITDLVNFMSIL